MAPKPNPLWFPEETKQRIIQRFRNGETVSAIAASEKPNKVTINRWIKKAGIAPRRDQREIAVTAWETRRRNGNIRAQALTGVETRRRTRSDSAAILQGWETRRHNGTDQNPKAWETRRRNGTDKNTDEQRRKISAAKKGKVMPEETRTKISATLRGQNLSPELKKIIKRVAEKDHV